MWLLLAGVKACLTAIAASQYAKTYQILRKLELSRFIFRTFNMKNCERPTKSFIRCDLVGLFDVMRKKNRQLGETNKR